VSLLRGLSLRRGSRCRRRLFRWVLGLRLRRLSSRICLRTMARTVRKELRLTPELAAAVDGAREDVSFNRFVERALEHALGVQTGSSPEPVSPPVSRSPSAPARASEFERKAAHLEQEFASGQQCSRSPLVGLGGPVRRRRAWDRA
jgi:hypothetical protein